MPREIKFKFWDKHNKVWAGPYTLEQLADHDQFSSDREWKPICSGWEYYESVEYADLKDCKVNEIYECDIVKWLIFPEGKDPTYVVDVVQCSRGVFYAQIRQKILALIEPHRKLEIIGNIYENPELLKGINLCSCTFVKSAVLGISSVTWQKC